MINRIPLIAETTSCSVAPNGFDQRSRWRNLFGSEVVNEPANEDPAILDPSQARDTRKKQGLCDEKATVDIISVTITNY